MLASTFRTPTGTAPNCVFLSHWKQDQPTLVNVPLDGRAHGLYLLMAGTTLPQCSRMQHGTVSVTTGRDVSSRLALRNPENWWPIEQDYLLDDYLFVNNAPLPPRVDLRTGQTRSWIRRRSTAKDARSRAARRPFCTCRSTRHRSFASCSIEVDLYGIVVGLMAATLVRA